MSVDNSELQWRFDALKRKNEATGFAVKQLEKLNAELTNQVEILEKKNKQLINKAITKDKIIHNTLELSNKQNDEYLKEIQRLRKECEN